MTIFSFFQKMLFPWRCLGCGKFDEILCPRCRLKLKFLKMRIWENRQGDNYLKIYSFFKYQESSGLISRLLKLLKYQSMESIIKCLEEILLSSKELFRTDWNLQEKIYYVPIPLHWRRQCERGFNQATILAKIFQKIWPGELVEDLFVRNQYTMPQANLGREDRLKNLHGKFILQSKILDKLDKNAQFILVDDVITTGSTLWALIEELQKVKINNYLGLSLARD